MSAYRRYFVDQEQILFLTLVTAGRRPWLSIQGAREQLRDALRATQAKHPFRHYGYVLLNDHLHLLISAQQGTQIPRIVGSFKQAVLARLKRLPQNIAGRAWQRRYYDHIIRDESDFARHLDYLHYNPVKHGLVEHAKDWEWSSLVSWQARGVYQPDWGSVEPASIRNLTE